VACNISLVPNVVLPSTYTILSDSTQGPSNPSYNYYINSQTTSEVNVMINLNNLNVSATSAVNYSLFKNNNQTFSLIRITGAINITGPLYFSLFSISSGTTYNCIDIELGSVNLTSSS